MKTRVEEIVDDMVEINLVNEDSFNTVKETLTRIGIMNKVEKKLFQTCHIFHRRGKYYICHFKEMMLLDGKPVTLNEQDIQRRNRIVNILFRWGFITPVNNDYMENMVRRDQIEVLPYLQKEEWELVPKYSIGIKH